MDTIVRDCNSILRWIGSAATHALGIIVTMVAIVVVGILITIDWIFD